MYAVVFNDQRVADSMNKPVNILLALILPPVGVYARSGIGWQLALNVFLCFAFFIPAVVHAVWYVNRTGGTPGAVTGGDGGSDESPPADRHRERREPSLS